MKGFTLFYQQKDYFIETDRKNKTEKLAKEICHKLFIPDGRAKELMWWLRKAECEIEPLANGKQLIRIHGDNFSICDISDSENTVIIKL